MLKAEKYSFKGQIPWTVTSPNPPAVFVPGCPGESVAVLTFVSGSYTNREALKWGFLGLSTKMAFVIEHTEQHPDVLVSGQTP